MVPASAPACFLSQRAQRLQRSRGHLHRRLDIFERRQHRRQWIICTPPTTVASQKAVSEESEMVGCWDEAAVSLATGPCS